MSDLISRQDAIEAVCKSCSIVNNYHKCTGYPELSTWCDELVALRALPSAEAVQGWIPCSERLPEERGEYLVSYHTTFMGECIDIMRYGKPLIPNTKVKGKCWYRPDDEWGDVVYDEILAWMPLPKPYTQESEVEE